MTILNNRTVFAFALTALVAALHTAPANAGGRSGAHALMAEPHTQTKQRTNQTETQMQAQIEALRKEVAEIKTQQVLSKGQPTAAQ